MSEIPLEELVSAYLDDELSPSDRQRIEIELASNTALQELYQSLQQQRQWFRALPRQSLPHDLSPKILELTQALSTEGPAATEPRADSQPSTFLPDDLLADDARATNASDLAAVTTDPPSVVESNSNHRSFGFLVAECLSSADAGFADDLAVAPVLASTAVELQGTTNQNSELRTSPLNETAAATPVTPAHLTPAARGDHSQSNTLSAASRRESRDKSPADLRSWTLIVASLATVMLAVIFWQNSLGRYFNRGEMTATITESLSAGKARSGGSAPDAERRVENGNQIEDRVMAKGGPPPTASAGPSQMPTDAAVLPGVAQQMVARDPGSADKTALPTPPTNRQTRPGSLAEAKEEGYLPNPLTASKSQLDSSNPSVANLDTGMASQSAAGDEAMANLKSKNRDIEQNAMDQVVGSADSPAAPSQLGEIASVEKIWLVKIPRESEKSRQLQQTLHDNFLAAQQLDVASIDSEQIEVVLADIPRTQINTQLLQLGEATEVIELEFDALDSSTKPNHPANLLANNLANNFAIQNAARQFVPENIPTLPPENSPPGANQISAEQSSPLASAYLGRQSLIGVSQQFQPREQQPPLEQMIDQLADNSRSIVYVDPQTASRSPNLANQLNVPRFGYQTESDNSAGSSNNRGADPSNNLALGNNPNLGGGGGGSVGGGLGGGGSGGGGGSVQQGQAQPSQRAPGDSNQQTSPPDALGAGDRGARSSNMAKSDLDSLNSEMNRAQGANSANVRAQQVPLDPAMQAVESLKKAPPSGAQRVLLLIGRDLDPTSSLRGRAANNLPVMPPTAPLNDKQSDK